MSVLIGWQELKIRERSEKAKSRLAALAEKEQKGNPSSTYISSFWIIFVDVVHDIVGGVLCHFCLPSSLLSLSSLFRCLCFVSLLSVLSPPSTVEELEEEVEQLQSVNISMFIIVSVFSYYIDPPVSLCFIVPLSGDRRAKCESGIQTARTQ